MDVKGEKRRDKRKKKSAKVTESLTDLNVLSVSLRFNQKSDYADAFRFHNVVCVSLENVFYSTEIEKQSTWCDFAVMHVNVVLIMTASDECVAFNCCA